MQAVLGTLEQYSTGHSKRLAGATESVGRWLREIFGCSHKEMSRPFSRHGRSYRVCIACGAQRRFDTQTWNVRGPYYYATANTRDLLETNTSSLRPV